MTAAGRWTVQIATPIGRQQAFVELSYADGRLRGTATDARSGETVPLTDLAVDGGHLRWRQAITKPMRLNLVFDVRVDGDTLSGTAKAGRLPASAVTGQRESADTARDCGH